MKAGNLVGIIHLVRNIHIKDNIFRGKNRDRDIIFLQEEIRQGTIHLQAETILQEAILHRSIHILHRREAILLHQAEITAVVDRVVHQVGRVVHQEEVPAEGRS